ncbi:MAG: LysR family transcriptional regulator [Zetaproteobacteria bacterium]|nr:MAG: LysR family transcriptional regulator [Zetaproteobacteria bacterium]
MELSTRQMRILDAVARTGSCSRAAEILFMSQPGVSMQIKQMEAMLGFRLFDRTGRRMRPTAEGRVVIARVREALAALRQAEEELAAIRGLACGRLHLTIASTANYFAPKLIAAFLREHPGIELKLAVANRAGLVRALAEAETDLAIMGKPPEELPLKEEAFLDNPLVVIAPPDHRLAARRRIPLAEAMREPFIVREAGSGTRAAVERFLAARGFTRSERIEMHSSEAIKQAVAAGLGLGVVSAHTLEMELALGRLAVLDVEGFPIMRKWRLVHRADRSLPPAARAFAAFVIKHACRLVSSPLDAPAPTGLR